MNSLTFVPVEESFYYPPPALGPHEGIVEG